MRTLLVLLLAGCLFFGSALAQDSTSPSFTTSSPASEGSFADLGRGVDLGNYLENPHPGDWAIKFEKSDYARIHDAGFTNVRIPLNWSAHTSAAPDYTIDAAYFQKVDENLQEARDAGLKIIIDDHNDSALMTNPTANTERFLAIWKQVAEHYKDQPSTVYFEPLNEPVNKLDAQHWNPLFAKVLTIIRQTNPDRPVIIDAFGGGSWAAVPMLTPPGSDHHVIFSFHYYDPLKFTHQGAAFVEGAQAWLGTTWTGTDAEKKNVTNAFDKVAVWANAQHRSVYVGEFGSYLKGDLDSRTRWTAFVARTAEAHGFGWSYYDYASGFGVCDPDTKEWIQPLLNALQPKS